MTHRNTLHTFFKLSALSSALLSATAWAADEPQGESQTELPTVSVSAERSQSTALATENNNEYTIPAMKSATGMLLSDRETPQTTSVITKQRMKDEKIRNVTEAMEKTNGVFVQAIDRGRSSYYSRGFTIDKYQIDGMNVNFNNQWIAGSNLTNMAMFDHVEVVRGATGLTTGSGNPSASVNFIRKHADSKTRKTSIEAGLGRWNNYEATLDHSQPLNATGSVRGRFVASRRAGKSWVDDEKNGQNILYGVIDADIGDNTEAGIGASYQTNHQNGYMWGGLPATFSDGSFADWPINKTTSTKWSTWDSKTYSYFGNLKHHFNNDWNVELKASHMRNSGDSKLMYISGSVDKATGLGYNVWPGKFDIIRKQNNVQLQTNGKYQAFGRKHDVVFGAQYSRNHNNTFSYAASAGFAAPTDFYNWDGNWPMPDWDSRSESVNLTDTERALFAATRLSLTDRLSAVVGTRFSNWKSKGTSYGTAINYESGNVWTPYAGLLYDINDNHTVYASYADIFKAQNAFNRNGGMLDPIRGKNYEIGLKSSYFDDRLTSQLSVFKIYQDNLAQADGSNIVPGSNNVQAYYAANGTRTHGFEAELTGRLTPQWNISFGYAFAKGKDADGNRINTSIPEHNLKLFSTYEFDNRLAGLTLGGGLNWQSSRYVNLTDPIAQKFTQKSYALVGLMGRYQFNKQLSAQVNIDNLFNKKYMNQMSANGQHNFGSPRNIRASMRLEF